MRAVIAASLILATSVAWAAESPDATPEQRREAVANGQMLPSDQRQASSSDRTATDSDPLTRLANDLQADESKRRRCEAEKKHSAMCYGFWRQRAMDMQQALQASQTNLENQIAITDRMATQLRRDDALERDLAKENEEIRAQAVAEIDKAYDIARGFINAVADKVGAAPPVVTFPVPAFVRRSTPTIPAPELSLAPPRQPSVPVFRSTPIRPVAPPLPTMTHCTGTAVGNAVTSLQMNCVTTP